MLSLLNIIALFFLIRFIINIFSGGNSNASNNTRGYSNSQAVFREALLKVMAAAMKADGRIVKAELNIVKSVLVTQFGEEEAKVALLELRDILRTNFDARTAAMNIGSLLSYADRLRIAEILCQIAEADGIITESEVQTVVTLSYYMGLSSVDTQRISARLHVNGGERYNYGRRDNYSNNDSYTNNATNAYKTLGISPDATNAEVKEAYRTLVKKYHPDKYATQGADAQAQAEQKFKEVQEAYETIKNARGL